MQGAAEEAGVTEGGKAPKISYIYAVEQAIWAAICVSWLAVRASASTANADVWILALPSASAVALLVLMSISPEQSDGPILRNFQATFGSWLASFLVTLESATTARVWQEILADPYISLVSLGVSLSLSTVQMLLSAAAVAPKFWGGQPDNLWADLFIVLATTFQACVVRSSNIAGYSVILFLNLLSVVCVGARLWELPEGVRLGAVTLRQMLESASFSLEMTSLLTAIALAYAYSTTSFATVVLSIPAVAVLSTRLAFSLLDRSQAGAQAQAGGAKPAPEVAPAPAEATLRTPLPAQSSQAFSQLNSRVAGDALLFSRTRALYSKSKKNS